MLFVWLCAIVVISIVIWKACDPFSDASFFLGRNVPGSVRGATIDAVASSMPEFFTTMSFLFIFNQYASGVATTAGSAIYNMIVIPAVCVFVIHGIRLARGENPELDVAKEVIWRDGGYFILSEIFLIAFLTIGKLTWWMGVVFILLYIGYVFLLWLDVKKYQRAMTDAERKELCGACQRVWSAVKARDKEALVREWQNFADSDVAEELEENPEEFWSSIEDHITRPEQLCDPFNDKSVVCRRRVQGEEGITIDFVAGKRPGLLRLGFAKSNPVKACRNKNQTFLLSQMRKIP